MAPPQPRDRVLLGAFFLSGMAALGYELLWTRLLALALGNETLGVLGVLAGFFAGLALGSFAFHGAARRARDPVRLFAILELIAAGYALVSPYLLHGLASRLPAVIGPIAGNNDTLGALAVAVAVAGLVLLPATLPMGATLPALVEARRRACPTDADGRGLGRLYAANTAGATIGVLVTVHILLPTLGMPAGAVVLAALGFAAAAIAWRWGKQHELPVSEEETRPKIDCSRDPDTELLSEPWLLHVVILGTGLCGVGLEVVGVQVLAQFMENTVYTFADVLAVYLVGTALGAWIYQRYADRAVAGRPATVTGALLTAMGIAVVIAAVALSLGPAMLDAVAPEGSGYARHLVAEMTVAVGVFLVPTILMGALFSHIVGLLAPSGVGRAYALNTVGAALAPFVFGLWAVETLGYSDSFYVVAYAYLVVFGLFTWFRRFRAPIQVGAIIIVVAATAIGPRSLVVVDADEGWEELERHETVMGLVSVSEKTTSDGEKTSDAPALRRLRVGRHFRMGGALAFGERRMGHIPLLLMPEAKSALFLGVGTGATLGAVRSFTLASVDAVELVPAVLETMEHFTAINENVLEDERVTFHAADARRFVAASSKKYDVIVADLFHPARDGAGSLYSLEHFENMRAHLSEQGLFAQWLPLYQFDVPNLAIVVRTFLEVFPRVDSFLGIYNVQTPAIVLIGRVGDGDLAVDLSRHRQRLEKPVYGKLLMQDARDLFGAYMLDRAGLAQFAGDGPLNTDLNPRVLFDAPRAAYEDAEGRHWATLVALLPHRTALPDGLLVHRDPEFVARFREGVAQYAKALDLYLQAEIERVQAGKDSRIPDAAVDGYLAAYDLDPSFVPARGMIYATAQRDADHAARIFPRLLERTPDERRVYQAYLGYLKKIGDEERFQEVLGQAQARFPPAEEQPSPP